MVCAVKKYCGYEWNVGLHSNPARQTSAGNDPFAVVVHCGRQKEYDAAGRMIESGDRTRMLEQKNREVLGVCDLHACTQKRHGCILR